MFSCSNGSEVVSNEQSNEAFDQILEEATKLKRKCKSLKALLLETETKRSEEGYAFEKSISNLKQELEETVSQLKAQNHIELCQMRDYRTNEVEELAKQLYAARNEIAMQEPLITTMTNKINSLENQMDSVLQYHKSEMDILKLDAKMQYDNYVREKDNDNQYHDEQQNILLNRAISAESELERLKSQNLVQLVDTMQNSIQEKDETIATLKFEKQSITCKLADSEEELTKIKEFADMLRSEKLKVADSIVYYQEENKRLDRQVELISADLDVANQKIARLQKSASNSNGNNSVNKTINGYYPHHMRTPMGSREGYNNSLYGGVGTSSSRGSMYSPRDSVTTTTTEVGEGMKSSIRKQIEQQKLVEDLREAHTQISELKCSVQELVRSKATVEEAVRNVLRDNEQLTLSFDRATVECQLLQKEIAMLRSNHNSNSSHSNSSSNNIEVNTKNVNNNTNTSSTTTTSKRI